jgi:hypothetical protein
MKARLVPIRCAHQPLQNIMSKFTLVYTGPEKKRGPELCGILNRHPEAMFVEKDLRVFEVTAETGFDESIGSDPVWHADKVEARK